MRHNQNRSERLVVHVIIIRSFIEIIGGSTQPAWQICTPLEHACRIALTSTLYQIPTQYYPQTNTQNKNKHNTVKINSSLSNALRPTPNDTRTRNSTVPPRKPPSSRTCGRRWPLPFSSSSPPGQRACACQSGELVWTDGS